MAESRKRQLDDQETEDEVPLYYHLELFFGDAIYIPRDKLQSLLVRATRTVPMTLMKPWRHLRNLIEAWEKYQIQTCPNQEQGLEEMEKVYNPLHAGHCSYSQFQNEESLCMMCFPLETTEKLRQFVTTLSEDSSKGPPSTESLPSHSTHEELHSHTSTSYTTAAGAMAHADVLSSLASSDDQIARQFGLQAPVHGTSTISSSISIVSPEYWNTLKWEEMIGVATLEMKFWDNSKVLDTSPGEFWKYCTRNFRIQLHVTTPMEVRRAVETLTRYAQERVQSAENVQKERRKNPSTTGYAKTPYRR
ncbi:uncharacterized protein LOC125757593 [Rhipicephalus sanguineus]|uniref:uncharacterized protein LOC125757593 n=1 Tax=Rhipicephalus sanguineus TaxID=34632 RepID=UPI0020C21AB9|nr:uncharacterized protein LOC125757593 [Rhipicephalus sanguineus]